MEKYVEGFVYALKPQGNAQALEEKLTWEDRINRAADSAREIVSALLDKGASLGAVLAFMMSVVGLSLPEIIILRRVLKPQLIAIFIGVIAVAIIITGYLFNLIV